MDEHRIKILVVDDQRLVRDGIASILSLYDDIDVCGTASDGEQAVTAAKELNPDIVLLDIRMPRMDGIQTAEQILSSRTAGAVLMLTTFDDEEYVVKALKAGASGYLLKDLPPEELHTAITTVHSGGFQSTSAVMGKLRGALQFDPRADAREADYKEFHSGTDEQDTIMLETYQSLTNREKEVLALIGEGATNYEIAVELGLSEGTVKNYVSGLLDTMGFRDRIQAAIFAARRSLQGH
ncbi:MAG: response regulator transcription factor [Spirochaetota bacterium]|nr:response regulator transcription factor [Spirochaetota bacterium]